MDKTSELSKLDKKESRLQFKHEYGIMKLGMHKKKHNKRRRNEPMKGFCKNFICKHWPKPMPFVVTAKLAHERQTGITGKLFFVLCSFQAATTIIVFGSNVCQREYKQTTNPAIVVDSLLCN